jgi:nitrite reductase (NADH) small subunit
MVFFVYNVEESRSRFAPARNGLRFTTIPGARMSDFHTICKVQDVTDNEGRAVAFGNKIIAVFRVEGQYYAIDDVCPHMGASLSGGYLENGIVTCPWHAWRFRLQDGAWADNTRIKIGCYPVRVVGDDIQIQVNQPAPNQPEKST